MNLAKEIAAEHYSGKEDIPELRVLFDDAEKRLEALIAAKLEPLRQLAIEGLCIDGEHHKQWYLEQILAEFDDIDVVRTKLQWEKGIAP